MENLKWSFARNINNMGEDGIVDIHSLTILCLCHEEQSKIILDALSLPSDKMEWVDVKTRLPEESGMFMCYSSHMSKQDMAWFDLEDKMFYTSGITHWQPLPHPPVK